MAEGFFIGDPNDMPEQIREALSAIHGHQDRQEMAATTHEHSINDFLANLDVEGLKVLQCMFRASAGGNDRTAIYFSAQIDTVLYLKHSICPLHGVNHDQELADSLASHTEGGEGTTT